MDDVTKKTVAWIVSIDFHLVGMEPIKTLQIYDNKYLCDQRHIK